MCALVVEVHTKKSLVLIYVGFESHLMSIMLVINATGCLDAEVVKMSHVMVLGEQKLMPMVEMKH